MSYHEFLKIIEKIGFSYNNYSTFSRYDHKGIKMILYIDITKQYVEYQYKVNYELMLFEDFLNLFKNDYIKIKRSSVLNKILNG